MPNHGAGGRPRKAPHLHIVDGTFRKDRHGNKADILASPDEVITIPPAPAHLCNEAAEIFLELCNALASKFVRTDGFIHLLSEAAQNLDISRKMAAICEDLGYTYMHEGAFGPVPKARPEFNMWLKAQARGESLLARFGLSPADIAKARPADGGKQADEFDDL